MQQILSVQTDPAYRNMEEKRDITGPEVRAEDILGEPRRYDHKNYGMVKVKDPTEHTNCK